MSSPPDCTKGSNAFNAYTHVSGLSLEGVLRRTDGYWCKELSTTPRASPRSAVNKQSEHLVNESSASDVTEGRDLAENSWTIVWDFTCVFSLPCVSILPHKFERFLYVSFAVRQNRMLRKPNGGNRKDSFLEADLTGVLLAISEPTAVVPGGIHTRKETSLCK